MQRSPLVAIDHQLHPAIDGRRQVAHQADEAIGGHAIPGPVRAEAHLARLVAVVEVAQRLFDQLVRIGAPVIAATAGGSSVYLPLLTVPTDQYASGSSATDSLRYVATP